MSLRAFQRAMVDLAASPALCARVREDAAAALAKYELTDVERRRLESAAAQRGMIVNGMLYRSNRLAPLNSQLPSTFLLLGPALRATAEAFWARYPSLERDAPTEVRRFAAFVQARAADGLLEEPLIPEVLAWEVDVFELALLAPKRVLAEVADDAARARPDGPLRLHPLVALSAFTVEPAALLTALFARRRPPYDDVPPPDGTDYYLLSDLRGEQRAFLPLPAELADVLLAVRDGGWVDRADAEALIERGWVVAE